MKAELEKRYRISALHKEYGYPKERLKEVARMLGNTSNPEAKRGAYYWLTAAQVKKYFG